MIPERKQTTGRILRTGWTDAGGFNAVSSRSSSTPGDSHPVVSRSASSTSAQLAAAPPVRLPAARRRRLRTLIAVVAMVGLLAIALPWLVLRRDGPEDVARDYLDALVDGDMETVRRHMAPMEGTLDTAITSAIHGATTEGISSYTIDRVSLRGTSAMVVATLRNRREEHRAVLQLHAGATGPFSPVAWQLAPLHLPVLNLSPLTDTDAVILNGQRLEIPEVRYTARGANRMGAILHVLPGNYVIDLPPVRPPLASRTHVIYVPPVLSEWRTGMITLDYGLTPSAQAQVRSVIRSALQECARSTSPQPVDCPFQTDLPAGTRGSWTVTQSPEIEYSNMLGDVFHFQGENLIAEFTVALSDDEGDSTEPASGAQMDLATAAATGAPARPTVPDPPAPGSVHATSAQFGASIRHSSTGYELTAWSFSVSHPLR